MAAQGEFHGVNIGQRVGLRNPKLGTRPKGGSPEDKFEIFSPWSPTPGSRIGKLFPTNRNTLTHTCMNYPTLCRMYNSPPTALSHKLP